jgi:hypothetical protein
MSALFQYSRNFAQQCAWQNCIHKKIFLAPDECTWQWVPGQTCQIAGSGSCGSGVRPFVCDVISQPPGSTCCTDSPPAPQPCEVQCRM